MHLATLKLLITLLLVWPAVPSSAETVTVDLGVDRGAVTYRASGFLTGHNDNTVPSSLFVPLKLKMWRNGHGDVANPYASQMPAGSQAQYIIGGDCYLCSSINNGDYSSWVSFVQTTVNTCLASGIPFEWDIWNEPNNDLAVTQFEEAWREAVVTIRALSPGAVIVGPSLNGFAQSYLQAFLLYARDHNVLPDVLSWHEFTYPTDMTGNIAAIRAWMVSNGINVPRISINEMVGPNFTFSPGPHVWYFAAAERAGIDSAAHACWQDVNGIDDCSPATLDGLLSPIDQSTRSTWWATKAYAAITGRLTDVIPGATTDGVAGKDAASSSAQILVGRFSGGTDTIEVLVKNVSQVISGSSVHVHAEQIPYSGTNALSVPTPVIDADYTVSGNQLSVLLPNFGGLDAYTVRLTGSTGDSTPPASPTALRVQ